MLHDIVRFQEPSRYHALLNFHRFSVVVCNLVCVHVCTCMCVCVPLCIRVLVRCVYVCAYACAHPRLAKSSPRADKSRPEKQEIDLLFDCCFFLAIDYILFLVQVCEQRLSFQCVFVVANFNASAFRSQLNQVLVYFTIEN